MRPENVTSYLDGPLKGVEVYYRLKGDRPETSKAQRSAQAVKSSSSGHGGSHCSRGASVVSRDTTRHGSQIPIPESGSRRRAVQTGEAGDTQSSDRPRIITCPNHNEFHCCPECCEAARPPNYRSLRELRRRLYPDTSLDEDLANDTLLVDSGDWTEDEIERYLTRQDLDEHSVVARACCSPILDQDKIWDEIKHPSQAGKANSNSKSNSERHSRPRSTSVGDSNRSCHRPITTSSNRDSSRSLRSNVNASINPHSSSDRGSSTIYESCLDPDLDSAMNERIGGWRSQVASHPQTPSGASKGGSQSTRRSVPSLISGSDFSADFIITANGSKAGGALNASMVTDNRSSTEASAHPPLTQNAITTYSGSSRPSFQHPSSSVRPSESLRTSAAQCASSIGRQTVSSRTSTQPQAQSQAQAQTQSHASSLPQVIPNRWKTRVSTASPTESSNPHTPKVSPTRSPLVSPTNANRHRQRGSPNSGSAQDDFVAFHSVGSGSTSSQGHDRDGNGKVRNTDGGKLTEEDPYIRTLRTRLLQIQRQIERCGDKEEKRGWMKLYAGIYETWKEATARTSA